jgi:AraC-like DNA-binding protein
VSVTDRAVWYIESHLSGNLTLDTIADAVGVSRFHLSHALAHLAPQAARAHVRTFSTYAPAHLRTCAPEAANRQKIEI